MLDPLNGIVGAILVTVWAVGLRRDTRKVLLDAEMDPTVVEKVREVVAACDPTAIITDQHVWHVCKGKFASFLSIVAHGRMSAENYRDHLAVGGVVVCHARVVP